MEDKALRNAIHTNHVRDLQARAKALVLEHYGGKCECCGETNPFFLTIDHINHNRNKNQRGWRWVIKAEFPADLRLLCFNCNCGRELNEGLCPHKGIRNKPGWLV